MKVETNCKKKGTKKRWKNKIKKTLQREDDAVASANDETNSLDDDDELLATELRWSIHDEGEQQPDPRRMGNTRTPSLPAEEMYLSEDTEDGNEQKKKKKGKKKKVKAKSEEKQSSSKSKRSGSSPSRSKKDKTKNNKKKKRRDASRDTDSCSDDSFFTTDEELDSTERTVGTAGTEGSTALNDSSEALSDRRDDLKNKTEVSLTSLGDLGATSALIGEFATSARSIEVRNSQRNSHGAFEQAFTKASKTLDRESSLGRMTLENKNMMENLLNELHHCELQLEEERKETAKERAAMQMKQENVEHMLEMEMNKVSELESQNQVLRERLEASLEASQNEGLLEQIKMLETQNKLLREKTERQGQNIARMSMTSRPRNRNEDIENEGRMSLAMPKMSGKEQGELLMLRSAFEEQGKELAKTKEQLYFSQDHRRVQELEQTVANTEQQIKFFLEEIVRLKKLLGTQKPEAHKFSLFGGAGKQDENRDGSGSDADNSEAPEPKMTSWWTIS